MNTSYEIKGFSFSATSARVKSPNLERLDFALVKADAPAVTAGVTTTNLVYAAPVEITREHLTGGLCQAILLNSGNANAVTGERGKRDALTLLNQAAGEMNIYPELIIPMSTGVIGTHLPVERMSDRIPDLVRNLAPDRLPDVADAIMTTDTVPKTVVLDGELSNGPIRMVGITKGAGMIAPNMATLLAAVMVDVEAELPFLQEALTAACDRSFNRITIDGDTSTNDTLIVMTGGRSDALKLGFSDGDREIFRSMLNSACLSLARQIVMDGEGATKLIEIRVIGAPGEESAARIARTVSESPLVKTAFNGEDPNWGRIIAAAGRAGVCFNPNEADLFIGEVPVFLNGAPADGDWETPAHEIMKQREFLVTLDLKSGTGAAIFFTTDFSCDYVRINADYRT